MLIYSLCIPIVLFYIPHISVGGCGYYTPYSAFSDMTLIDISQAFVSASYVVGHKVSDLPNIDENFGKPINCMMHFHI